MTPSPATAVCFLAGLVCLAAACVAIWWGWDERRENLRLKQRLHEANRRLTTYRQWADDHIYLAFQPSPEDQEQ